MGPPACAGRWPGVQTGTNGLPEDRDVRIRTGDLPGGERLKVRLPLPTKWKKYLSIIAEWRDFLPDRLGRKIGRLNKRMMMFEKRWRSA